MIGWGEAFTGAIIFARDRNRLRSDRTGLREVQQGYICAQKSSTPTQVRIARVSLSSSQAPWHWNPGDVPHCQQHLGIQHRLSQVLLLQLQPQLLSPSPVLLLLLLLLLLVYYHSYYSTFTISTTTTTPSTTTTNTTTTTLWVVLVLLLTDAGCFWPVLVLNM